MKHAKIVSVDFIKGPNSVKRVYNFEEKTLPD